MSNIPSPGHADVGSKQEQNQFKEDLKVKQAKQEAEQKKRGQLSIPSQAYAQGTPSDALALPIQIRSKMLVRKQLSKRRSKQTRKRAQRSLHARRPFGTGRPSLVRGCKRRRHLLPRLRQRNLRRGRLERITKRRDYRSGWLAGGSPIPPPCLLNLVRFMMILI